MKKELYEKEWGRLTSYLKEKREKGELVVFCGAGVSRAYAEFPLFKEVIEELKDFVIEIMQKEKAVQDEVKKFEDSVMSNLNDFKNDSYALSLIQTKYKQYAAGQHHKSISILKNRIFESFKKRYEPIKKECKKLLLHKDIIQISNSNQLRILNLNWDDLFYIADNKIEIADFHANPKYAHNWTDQSFVFHLHGRIPSNNAKYNYNELVVFIEDYKDGYDTYKFRCNFLSDTLRDYTVLFVGCSIEKKILDELETLAELYRDARKTEHKHVMLVEKEEYDKWDKKIGENTYLPLELLPFEQGSNYSEEFARAIQRIKSSLVPPDSLNYDDNESVSDVPKA